MKFDWESEFRIRKIVCCLFFQSSWLEGAKIWKGGFCLLKVILLDVSAKLVLGKATPWCWCLGKGRCWRSDFCLPKIVFFHLPPELVPGAWKNDVCLPIIVFQFFFTTALKKGLEKVIFACRQSFLPSSSKSGFRLPINGFSILVPWGLPIIVFPSSSRVGALGGAGGLKKWFSPAENRFFPSSSRAGALGG